MGEVKKLLTEMVAREETLAGARRMCSQWKIEGEDIRVDLTATAPPASHAQAGATGANPPVFITRKSDTRDLLTKGILYQKRIKSNPSWQ